MTRQISKYNNSFLPSMLNDELFFGSLTPLERVIDEFFKSETPDFVSIFGQDFFKKNSYPKSDVMESNEWVKIEMDVPGLTKDQINIELTEVNKKQCLVISGESRSEHEKTDDITYHYRELKKSAFKKPYFIDAEKLDVDKIDAQFENGVITLTIPKRIPEQLINKNKKIELK